MIRYEFNIRFSAAINDDCITCNRSCEKLMYSLTCKHCGEKGWECCAGFLPVRLEKDDNGEPVALEKCQKIARKIKGTIELK